MLIRGKAPLRISFCGGGSDVSPYCDEYGGCVLSTTIAMHAMGSLEVRADNQVSIFSVDYDELVHYELENEINEGDKLSFLRAVIKRLNPPRGLNLYMHSDAPPGTGLGSSGTISALIVGLINQAFNLMLSKYDMARIAYQVEHDDLGRAVGRQDHYAAVFGGMNFMEFGAADPVVYPLRIEPWIMEELGYHLQMFYTRKKRDSTDIVASQVTFYEEKRPETMAALTEMKAIAREMQRCLVQGKLKDFGRLLHEAWLSKQRMNPGTTNPYLSEIYETARRHGALGGKILGAGGGGFFMFFTPFTQKGEVTRALTALGVQPTPMALDLDGMRTWQVPEQDLVAETGGLFRR
jgi:D-glycero-alpha-D-manno-heptose-7-phosphate kinase